MEEYAESTKHRRDNASAHSSHEVSAHVGTSLEVSSSMDAASVTARQLLGDKSMRGRGNSSVRAATIQGMQQAHGNRAVQRSLQAGSVPVQRDGEEGHHHEPGWIDNLFGLNPDRSFVRAGLEGLYGPDSPAQIKEGDSDWTKLGRAGYSAAVSPLALGSVLGGEILDKVNHPSELLLGPFAGPF